MDKDGLDVTRAIREMTDDEVRALVDDAQPMARMREDVSRFLRSTRFARCAACNWPAYVVSRDWARAQVESFNESARRAGEEPRASLDHYLRCFKCGASSARFVEATLTEREHDLVIQPCITPWSVLHENYGRDGDE